MRMAADRRTFLKTAAGTAAVIAIEPRLVPAPPRLRAPVNVGLVGAGRQGRALLGELAKFKDVRVVALCDSDPSRLRSGLRRARGAKGYDGHAKLLEAAQDVNAVLVATPTHLHADIALAALAAGKHVYCEAPLAHTLEDCRKIVRAARGASTVFQTGMQGRSNPVYKLARSFVRAGAIRDVVAMRAQMHKKTSWRTPAPDPKLEKARNWKLDPAVSLGLIGEFGTHQFDVLHWFLGSYPTAVRASGAVLAWRDGREVADTAYCELRFKSGARLAYQATLANSFEGRYELLAGTMGTIKLAWTHGWMFKEADAPTQGWEVYANRQQFHNDEGITLIAEATKLAAQGKLTEGVGLPHPPLYYAVESFLESITEQKPVVCSAGEGLRAAAVSILAKEALASGREVAIDEKTLQVDQR